MRQAIGEESACGPAACLLVLLPLASGRYIALADRTLARVTAESAVKKGGSMTHLLHRSKRFAPLR